MSWENKKWNVQIWRRAFLQTAPGEFALLATHITWISCGQAGKRRSHSFGGDPAALRENWMIKQHHPNEKIRALGLPWKKHFHWIFSLTSEACTTLAQHKSKTPSARANDLFKSNEEKTVPKSWKIFLACIFPWINLRIKRSKGDYIKRVCLGWIRETGKEKSQRKKNFHFFISSTTNLRRD